MFTYSQRGSDIVRVTTSTYTLCLSNADEVVYLNPPMEAKGHVKNEDIKNEEDTVEEEQEKLS